ncbi:tRNA dihydrouridine(20/20a) synthase DusA [Neptunomonas japonica]|uniref:tRNA dihydrouridine(20/20a) synthase DusA n=1 Tax=Neptunomonas japonica TaxID=417574 RepID=UPI00247FECB4|nr:tRNA dihydrouridine(20/20a) synthase DusA [Neptunomonas japonica]
MNISTNTALKPGTTRDTLDRRFCIAPMMDWTDKHCRMFHRILSKNTVLYSEMVTSGALIFGDKHRHLAYNEGEHPVALQLGGSDPIDLAKCARLAQEYGYDEVNLNVGCPSDRVQNNMIGACLMEYPEKVRDCMSAMQDAVDIPVTIKHRLGIDNLDSDELLHHFVDTVQTSGCSTFIVHARKAILQGLSPKENRDVPPLQYDRVYKLKQAFPELEIIINGGIKTLDDSQEHLKHVDGVMMGREAYQNPYILAEVDSALYGISQQVMSRIEAVEAYLPYIEEQLRQDVYLNHISRHILGIFHGMPGGKQFRRLISEEAHKRGAGIEVIQQALAKIKEFN